MRRHSGFRRALVLTLGVALSASAVEAASRKPYGGEVILPRLEELATSDPARLETDLELEVARQLHETLLRCPARGALQPGLAIAVPRVSDDGLEVTLQLRPDAVFQDGTAVTSEELVVSWERLLRPETGSRSWWLLAPVRGALGFRRGKLNRVTGLERMDRLSVRLRLEAPMPGFLGALCAVPTAPLPLRVLQRKGESAAHPVGSGPFQVADAGADGGLSLRPFEGHWRGRPFLDKLVLQPFASHRDAALAFELGRVHLLREAPLERRAGQTFERTEAGQVAFLVIHRGRLQGAPEGLRQAIEAAVDRRSMVEYLLGDAGRPTDEALILETDEPASARTDLPAARAYFQKLTLQRLGMPVMLEFMVRAWRPLERAVAERVQVNLLDAGVSVAVVPLGREAYAGRLAEGRYDLRLEAPLPLVRDPELQLIGLVAQAQGEDAVEDVLRTTAAMPHGPSRAGLIRERARHPRLLPDWIPLFVYGPREARHPGLRDLQRDASGSLDWADAWLAE
jgi:ABC-type transport system substrate-binding protein